MPYSRSELLDTLRAYDRAHGHPPTSDECNDADELPSTTTYVYRFGGLNAAIEAAGLEPRNRRRSREELLEDLRDLAAGGRHPTYRRVEEHPDLASARTYDNRFGSFGAALREAGLPSFDER